MFSWLVAFFAVGAIEFGLASSVSRTETRNTAIHGA
jgi:hypothetical protein